jgi:hypothetical protein
MMIQFISCGFCDISDQPNGSAAAASCFCKNLVSRVELLQLKLVLPPSSDNDSSSAMVTTGTCFFNQMSSSQCNSGSNHINVTLALTAPAAANIRS